jgi:hypothetical protein
MMKKLLLTLTIVILSIAIYGEVPAGISYQAVIRDNNNQLVTSQQVGVKISILVGEAMDSVAYSELHTASTNMNGLLTLEIGNGDNSTGVFNNINWSEGPYFIKTETDPQGGTNYTVTGTSQLLSVPYALHSRSSDSLILPYVGVIDSPQNAFSIVNSYSQNDNRAPVAIFGRTSHPNGVAVSGVNNSTSGYSIGLFGSSFSNTGYAGYFQGRLYVTYRIGIGVLNPQESLHLTGNIRLDDGIRSIMNGSNNALNFGTNNIVRMRIAANGNVGIGDINPGERLHVDGNIRVSGGNRTIINSSNNSLSLGTNNTVRMLLTNTGNVGIGVNNPQDLLHVNGNIRVSGGNRIINNSSNNALSFATNNTVRMRISANGNVGIGTTNTTDRLTVNGNTRLNGNIILQGGNRSIANSTSNASLSFGTNSTVRMLIQGDGIVRINETLFINSDRVSTIHNLWVNGSAGKTVGGTTWSIPSDIRLKTISGDYTKGLNEISALKPLTFFYKEDNPRSIPHNTENIGFIAQDVQKIFPEAVWEGSDGYLEFDMHSINVALINAIKELKNEIEMLKTVNELFSEESDKLKKENTVLFQSVTEMNSRLQNIEKLYNEVVKSK